MITAIVFIFLVLPGIAFLLWIMTAMALGLQKRRPPPDDESPDSK